jgi:hypothetical protein
MAKRYTDKFRRDAMRIATTSGLTRPQLSSDLGVGLSLKWSGKTGQRAKMYSPRTTGYTNDQETQLFRQV